MAFEVTDLPQRDTELGPDELGPGLYDDESFVRLDSGDHVAVSVEPKWLPNGGVFFKARARSVEADGTTRLAPHGQHIKIAITFHAGPEWVKRLGVETIRRELMKAALGEPLTPHPDDTEANLLLLGRDVTDPNIRFAIETAGQTGRSKIGLPA